MSPPDVVALRSPVTVSIRMSPPADESSAPLPADRTLIWPDWVEIFTRAADPAGRDVARRVREDEVAVHVALRDRTAPRIGRHRRHAEPSGPPGGRGAAGGAGAAGTRGRRAGARRDERARGPSPGERHHDVGPRPDESFFACASVVPSARSTIRPFRFEQRHVRAAAAHRAFVGAVHVDTTVREISRLISAISRFRSASASFSSERSMTSPRRRPRSCGPCAASP